MSSERWRQLEEIFQTALDMPAAERASYVVKACAGDEELRRQVEALLAQNDEAGTFLDEPLYEHSGVQALADLIDDDPVIGQRIGAYKVVSQIGRGGMGAVYLAERDDNTFQRRVAIKLIKRGMDTDFILRRFRHERQILAALDHPYIARLLDGGATSTGQPYFVMEYIEGQPLYKHCDERRLSVRERLRLFCQVCEAVDYAHQKQVIHRDIKPSNILVSSDGVPKLFDFGIAKLLNPELATDTNPQTASAMRMMTVEYASPEQVQGLPVTFLSDVYSLGVLLYELLTGHRPYHFRSRQLFEMARVIMEEEPEMPSLSVARTDNLLPETGNTLDPVTVERVCELRGETPAVLSRELAGNIDRIIMKALRKVPPERYQSALSLRDDIIRHMEGGAVSAPVYTPNVTTHPTHIMSAKSPAAKSIAVLPLKILNLSPNSDTGDKFMSVGLADALITTLSGVRRLTVRPTSAVLRYGDEDCDPLMAGRELGVDFVLDGRIKIVGQRIRVSLQLLDVSRSASIWANQFDEQYRDALELEDSITAKVADALLPQLAEGERDQLKKRGTDNPGAFDAYLRGRYFWNQFTPESLSKVIESFQTAIRLDPNYALPHVGIADFYNWASIYGMVQPVDAYSKARAAALRALELDPDLGEAYAALGLLASSQWKWAESERLYQKALELSPNYSLAHEWYGSLLTGTGRFEEGMREIRRAEELDPLSPRAMTMSAWAFYQARHFDDAAAKAQQIIDLDKNFPQGYIQLGNCLEQMGRAEEAVKAVEKGMRLMPDSTLPQYVLCYALVAAGREREAREVLNEMKKGAAEGYVKSYFMALSYAALDEREAAFEFLEKAADERDHWLLWLGTEPKLDTLRADSRFKELFRQTKAPMSLLQDGGIVKEAFTGDAPSGARPLTARPARLERHRLTVLAALALLALAAVAAIGYFALRTQPARQVTAIAVLPFANATTSSEFDYLGDGLTESLIDGLSQLPGMKVISRGSSFKYKGKEVAAQDAAKALGVGAVVRGRIVRSDQQLQVSVVLFGADGQQLWGSQYQATPEDFSRAQAEISRDLARVLASGLSVDERRQFLRPETANPQAFNSLLKGRFYWNKNGTENWKKAIEQYEQALAADPSYAHAYAELSGTHRLLAIGDGPGAKEHWLKAEQMGQKALELDAENAEAHAALGRLKFDAWDWQGAERYLKRAVELNPNHARARGWYARCLSILGRHEEAVAEAGRARELDPLSALSNAALGEVLRYARRFKDAVDLIHQTMDNSGPLTHLHLGYSYLGAGNYEEAAAEFQEAVKLGLNDSSVQIYLGIAYARQGERDRAQILLEQAQKKNGQSTPLEMAALYDAMGMRDSALAVFEQAYQKRDREIYTVAVDAIYDGLRTDPTVQDMLRKIGLAQ
ncbi:MAG TPA: protein kinase [Pyrinomonadaceae bacterium]|jgi:serine/threonine protein kinase/tetratricopeptide (TPR) repeat protein